jgi:sugar-specific transcriptional regulator TrmB
MITLTLLVAPIAIKDVMSFSSSRVSQFNKLEKGEIVLIQDSVENKVLTYTDANSSNEPYNIYKDIGIGKIILQVAGYSMLMLLILVVLLTFLNIDNTVSGSGSSTKPTKPAGLTRLYKPLVMTVVTGVLIWAYIKFIYIDYFENSIRPYLDKTKTKVNNLNSTIASCTTTNTQLLNTIASDNEAEFKKVVSSMSNSNDVSIAITHYSIYKYFKDTVADFDNSELRKKLVGTSTTANFQYANYIRIGCSKMIRNAFYDLDIAYRATLDSNAIETTVINKMKTLNVAKTTMKSEVDLIIPKFSSYLTQRTIGASSLFLISVFILFILYGQEIQQAIDAIVRFIRSIRGGDK